MFISGAEILSECIKNFREINVFKFLKSDKQVKFFNVKLINSEKKCSSFLNK